RERGRGRGAAGGRPPPAGAQAGGPGGDGRGGGAVTGRLAVVGTGPGSVDHLTWAAARELAAAELLIGYRAYLDLLPAALAPGRREPYALGQERERARRAVDAAAAGARVALVSSGDAGVYGTAALAVDEAVARGEAAPPRCAARTGPARRWSCRTSAGWTGWPWTWKPRSWWGRGGRAGAGTGSTRCATRPADERGRDALGAGVPDRAPGGGAGRRPRPAA